MRPLILVLALSFSAAPAFAQVSGQHSMRENVTGGGQLPAGWHARRDNKAANAELDNVKFVTMGSGFHATMGMTNAIFWNPEHAAGGEFEVSATLIQTKPNERHAEGAGLVIAGSNLAETDQSYGYFLVREGKFLINHRAGDEVHKLVAWTDHAAINKADASGKTSNTLAVKVQGDDVHFLVNGKVVQTLPRNQFKPDGVVGLRVNMHLDMHIADFNIKPAR